MRNLEKMRLIYDQGKYVVQIAAQYGEALFLQLASQGIEATVVRSHGAARLELEEDVNLEIVQQILHEWQGAYP